MAPKSSIGETVTKVMRPVFAWHSLCGSDYMELGDIFSWLLTFRCNEYMKMVGCPPKWRHVWFVRSTCLGHTALSWVSSINQNSTMVIRLSVQQLHCNVTVMIGRPYPRGSVLCALATSRHSLRYCLNKVFLDQSLASAYHYTCQYRYMLCGQFITFAHNRR